MTPAARVAAAIVILDDILGGRTAEKALSDWARGSRFAGSKDRAALRDLVFDALRKRASCATLGGGLTGRGLMIGLVSQRGDQCASVFTGEGHAPNVLSALEQAHVDHPPVLKLDELNDMPEIIWPIWQSDLGDRASEAAQVLRERAALYLRVNTRRCSVEDAIASLADEAVTTQVHASLSGCLEVLTNPRRVKLSEAYRCGYVEVQDAASQIAVDRLNIPSGARVLDYCAGGGGKSLAIAAQYEAIVVAHDISVARMKDIAPRAERAGVNVEIVETQNLGNEGLYDVVVVDAPCSGSGTWRRNPEAKWDFTPEKLNQFNALQYEVLTKASTFLAPGGRLYYMTCSVFRAENQAVVQAFSQTGSEWQTEELLNFAPSLVSDGFFMCQLTKST